MSLPKGLGEREGDTPRFLNTPRAWRVGKSVRHKKLFAPDW